MMGDAAAPAGSYQRSCGELNFTAGTLRATCRTSSGELRANVLAASTCRGTISNINGFLSCDASGDIPQGSYRRTCINPALAGDILSAICVRRDGALGGHTSLDVSHCGGDISNTDGNLGCNLRRTITVVSSGSGTTAKFNVKGDGFVAGAVIGIFVADNALNRRVFSQSAEASGTINANVPLSCVAGGSLTWTATDGTIEGGREVVSNAFTLPCP